MQEKLVWSLVQEDPTCCSATKPMATTTEARVPRAGAPQQGKPRQWEAHAPQTGNPCSLQPEKARAAVKTQHSQKWINV